MKTFVKKNFFKLMIGSSLLIFSISVLIYIISTVKSNTSSADRIIGDPITIGKIEITQNNFPKMMNWDDANGACNNLGNSWRLPTIKELNLMFKNKYKIGGFVKDYYWSSTEGDNVRAWRYIFHDGNQEYGYKGSDGYVRAVRSL